MARRSVPCVPVPLSHPVTLCARRYRSEPAIRAYITAHLRTSRLIGAKQDSQTIFVVGLAVCPSSPCPAAPTAGTKEQSFVLSISRQTRCWNLPANPAGSLLDAHLTLALPDLSARFYKKRLNSALVAWQPSAYSQTSGAANFLLCRNVATQKATPVKEWPNPAMAITGLP